MFCRKTILNGFSSHPHNRLARNTFAMETENDGMEARGGRELHKKNKVDAQGDNWLQKQESFIEAGMRSWQREVRSAV